jgi:hypothetical protein
MVRGVSFRGSFVSFFIILSFFSSSLPFQIGLPLFVPFVSFAVFPSTWPSWIFFLGLWSSSCVLCALDPKFKLYAFWCQCTHQGEDWETKWSVPWFNCDESLTNHGLNLKPGYFSCFTLLFMWRITFACLVVCRWQVRHDGQWWGSWQE